MNEIRRIIRLFLGASNGNFSVVMIRNSEYIFYGFWGVQRCVIWILLISLVFLAACETAEMPVKNNETFAGEHSGQHIATETQLETSIEGKQARESSLLSDSILSRLALNLDRRAIARSSGVPNIESAKANLSALRFERLPQLRPSASAPLTGGGGATYGLSVNQIIWDGGRIKSRMSDAHLEVVEATLEAWDERNTIVYDGLEAFVEISRFEAQLREHKRLLKELEVISGFLQTRREGGVADRGETLRMTAAVQETERRLLTSTSALRKARADLAKLLPEASETPALSDLDAAATQCRRDWPKVEAPMDALARVSLSRAEASEASVRARRFPKLVLAGGTTYSESGWSEPSLAIRIEASDILGFGGKRNIDAAYASTLSAKASYALQREDTEAELARLEANYEGMRADVSALRGLADQNDETIVLFLEQLDAGSMSFTEGIALQRDRSDTLIDLSNTYADILLNCLLSSKIRGVLVPIGSIQ